MKKRCTFNPQLSKMKRIFLLLLVSVGVFAFSNSAEASHAAGGEILYEHVTGNTYKIIFKFYRDCGGINAPASVSLCRESQGCNIPPASVTMTKVSGPNIVSNGCPSFQNTCLNPQSPVPGYEEHVYEVQLTLQQCNFWRFWVTIGARNQMDFLSGGSLVIDATLNNSSAATTPDNSPYFSVKPVPYCCVGVPFTFNNGAIDINGDSLVFESVIPLRGPGCTNWSPVLCTYPGPPNGFPAGQPGNAATNPIPTNNTFTLNSQTGALSFTPTTQGTGVITIKCTSYRNGVLIGFVKRDIQVVVVAGCNPGQVPTPPVDTLSLVGSDLDSLGQVVACSGDSLSFCFTMGSSDTDAVLVPYSNISVSLPGATISYTGALTDTVLACVNWQTTQADTGLQVLVITLIDSSCKPPGILNTYSFTIPVFIDYGIVATGDTIICAGDNTQLSVSGGGDKFWTVLPGGSPLSSLSCVNCDNPIASPTLPTFYVAHGCDLDTVFVDVAQVPALVITPRTTTCVNSNLQLNVIPNPASQQYDYVWTPPDFLSANNIQNPVVQNPNPVGANSITYTVSVIPYGANIPLPACATTASVTVDVLKGFELDPHDSILCDGDSRTITGTGSTAGLAPDAYTYSWTPAATAVPNNAINTVITPAVPGGPYTITASFPGCPDSSITIPVIVDELPVVDAGIPREMCLNDTLHLNSSVFPDSANYYDITWSPGADMVSNKVADPVYSGKITQTLTVIYTTPNGCADTNSVLITVNNVDFLQLDGDRAICPGDTATLSVLGGVSYNWDPNYFISDIGNVTSVQVYPQATQDYRVIGKDFKGCFDTAFAKVVVYPGSVLDAGEDVTIYPGENVTLYADGNCSLFDWFPPSGLSDTKLRNPVAQPTATTRYYVSAQTENGCPTNDSVTVIVSNESLVDLPNVFSPGSGTSINDKLMIRKRGIVQLKSWDIFNRWGQRVFSTNDIEQGWDGRFNDKPQPLGTYVYVIEAFTSTGKRFYKQGNVTLVR